MNIAGLPQEGVMTPASGSQSAGSQKQSVDKRVPAHSFVREGAEQAFTFPPALKQNRKVRSIPPTDVQKKLVNVFFRLSDISTESELKHYIQDSMYGSGVMRVEQVIFRSNANIKDNDHIAKIIVANEIPPDCIPDAYLSKDLVINVHRRLGDKTDHSWLYHCLPEKVKGPDVEKDLLKTATLSKEAFLARPDWFLKEFQGCYYYLLEQNINCIRYLPGSILDTDKKLQELCRSGVKRDPWLICNIDSESVFARKMFVELLNKGDIEDSCLPYDYMSMELFQYLKMKYGINCLDYCCVREQIQDYDLYKEALNAGLGHRIPFRMRIQYPEFYQDFESDDHIDLEYQAVLFVKKNHSLLSTAVLEAILEKYPLTLQVLNREKLVKYKFLLDDSLKYGLYLDGSLADILNVEQCRIAIIQRPDFIRHIDQKILENNPDLVILAATFGELKLIPMAVRTPDVYYRALLTEPVNLRYTPEVVRKNLPAPLLLYIAPEYLPLEMRRKISKSNDFALPVLPTSKAWAVMGKDILLSPQKPHDDVRHQAASHFLKHVVMSTPAFNLRHQEVGDALQEFISQFCEQWKEKYTRKEIAVSVFGAITSEEGNTKGCCINYGGRAMMIIGQDKCSRYKFLREGEPLDEFFSEAAVQVFAKKHLINTLESEIPDPVDFTLIPVSRVPKAVRESFSSAPEVIMVDMTPCYLCFEFTTNNEHYSTLAHTKISNDNSLAIEGILKACHDLGVWSSLGALHTSTLKAYHRNRRELFLIHLFNNHYNSAGRLDSWDSLAIQESDWGYTGLRDIGDLEFYPAISSVFGTNESVDKTTLPGFDQRAAFLNTVCENMVAAVLHYGKLRRDDDDYHYKNKGAVRDFSRFLDQVLSRFLTGLYGTPQTVCDYFESADVYQEWLTLTATEGIMWTARQSMDRDCFARTLQCTGCYPPEVYPLHFRTYLRYPQKFTTDGRDNLGADSSTFGMTCLMFGLYQIAASIAVKSSEQET